ncbi:hypothetical protein ACWEO1_36975 [Kitasatospora cineracea]
MNGLDWVPASCTLPTEERPLRVAEWDALFAEQLESIARPELLRAQLVLRGGEGVEERVRDLVEREGGCCSFFAFTVTADRGAVVLDVAVDAAHAAVLDVAVDAAHAAVLDGLERRAAAAGGLR